MAIITGDTYAERAAAGTLGARNDTSGKAGSPGVTSRGVWNSGASYSKNDIVNYLTSSYIATTAVAAGGQSPAVNTTSWALLVSGGGEIAGADITANFAPTMTAGVLFDIPGASIVIPAGTGAYEVKAFAPMIQFVFAAGSATGNLATVRLLLVDEGNVTLNQSIVRVTTGVAGAVTQWQQSQVSRRMPATGTAKTIKLSGWLDTVANITSITFWAGTGAGTPPGTGTLGPLSISAVGR